MRASLVVVSGAVACAIAHAKAPRIVGGVTADAFEYPHIVSIRKQRDDEAGTPFTHECTASLISPEWVLTARHHQKG